MWSYSPGIGKLSNKYTPIELKINKSERRYKMLQAYILIEYFINILLGTVEKKNVFEEKVSKVR